MDFHLSPEEGRFFNLDLREGSVMLSPTLNREIPSLPLSGCSYGYFYAGPDHFTQRNASCPLYQVFITHSGCGRLLLRGKTYLMRPGSVALLDLRQPHRYETAGDHWEHEWVNFDGPCCAFYYGLINRDGFAVYDMGAVRAPVERMRELRACMQLPGLLGRVHSGTQVLALLDSLCDLAAARLGEAETDSRENVLRSARYIEEHYAEKLTLDELAGVAFLSKYYYTRAFSRCTGMTPYEYLNSVRLSQARRLLFTSTLSVEEIGWTVGFGGGKNFIRRFKQATGATPGEYRRQINGEGE